MEVKKKKIDPVKLAEKMRADAARMEQMGQATGPSRRSSLEDVKQSAARTPREAPKRTP